MSKKKTKEPRITFGGFFVKGLKAALLIEVGGLVGSYLIWRKLNTDQDFRLFMYKNCNWLLEGYYKPGELLRGDSLIRDTDLAIWKEDGKI